jgi:predicted RNA-binding Zn ribbon-like protein
MRLQMAVPEVPDPPFASGAPYWYWLGGRPALDLVNTRRERWNRDIECLVTVDDAVAWLVQAELLPAPVAAPEAVLHEARALREAIDGAVRACVEGRPVDPADVTLIDDWLVHAGARPQLALSPDGAPCLAERPAADSPRRALGMVALDAAQMLGDHAERARIRVCGSETCSARFYDRSPAGRRRWCSMAACGNVEKVRRHRARGAAA